MGCCRRIAGMKEKDVVVAGVTEGRETHLKPETLGIA
jgi:hypothetical protein